MEFRIADTFTNSLAWRTHTSEAYAALSGPILREIQELERVVAYLSQVPGVAS
jgi:hypothetical protein